MDLIEVYIHEVTRRIPEKSRKDIGLELRSTIEDMLPDDYSEEDVKSALEKLGNPAVLASRYLDRPMHLIGPRYFDIYVSLLKMSWPIAAMIGVISVIAEFIFGAYQSEALINTILDIIGVGIWRVIEISIQMFFWFTLVFAIMERADKVRDRDPLSMKFSRWTADELKSIPYIPKKRAISRVEVFGGLLWTAIWATVYYYAHSLAGIYEGSEDGLGFVTPAFNQEVLDSYWPLVLVVIGLEITLALYKFIKGQWTKQIVVFNAITELLAFVTFIMIITSQNLFQPEFLSYMSNLFSVPSDIFVNRVVTGSIVIYVFFAAINVYDGFRKSRMR